MASKLNIIIFASILLVTCPALPKAGYAQSDGGNILKQPRNMATTGALTERRPGNWVNRARAVHNERQQKAIHAFGGANYTQTESDEEPSLRKNLMMAFLESLSDLIAQLGDLFTLLLEAQQPQQPELVE